MSCVDDPVEACVDDPVEARAIWYVRRGRVRSCVRPTLRGLGTAGPDAIRSLGSQTDLRAGMAHNA